MSADLKTELSTVLGATYRIERELSGGGMSRVFTAEDIALGRVVVIKVLPPELSGVINVERFKREIQMAARLQHAHIVPVLSTGEIDGMPYYTMPFVDGESLGQRIRRAGPLPFPDAISILRDVARALGYAHERGIIHRDIKPDNVMLSGGSAVVTDFGIAKAINDARHRGAGQATLTQVGTSLGTPAYMAPEQAAGDQVDHRADLYAFGCMAYEMLTGRLPFVETSLQKLFAAHLSSAPDRIASRRPDIPPRLDDLVMRCLAKHAEDRPENAAAILQLLDMVGSGRNPTAVLAREADAAPAPPSHPEIRPSAGAGWFVTTRSGLAALLVLVAVVNLVETAYDARLGAITGVLALRDGITRALISIEGTSLFRVHDITSTSGVYAASAAYFFLFPLILLAVGVALARKRAIGPLRTVVLAAAVDYAVSLQFYLFYPVPERWSVPASDAALLSNRWSTRLIELIRPMSGLDNCFPSFHVSLLAIAVTACMVFGLGIRWSVLCASLAVLLSTYVLGIHWVPDIIAGTGLGVASFAAAWRIDWRLSDGTITRGARRAATAAVLALATIGLPSRAGAQTSLTFAAVALDADTRRADDRLRRYLEETARVSFVAEDASEYGHVIDYLAAWRPGQGNYVARVTPYALVAAELLGAQVQVLGTYVSRATSSTTYQAYFVVGRGDGTRAPELADIPPMLRLRPSPPTFAYHSEFSTSSFFLPAIFFRRNDVFDMPASTEHATAIRARPLATSSSDLVKGVANGRFDIAAVWSGTKASFEKTDSLRGYLSRVHFVPMPEALPNDLLIASAGLDSATADRIRGALSRMPPTQIDIGDFVTWRHINDAPEAREALAALRWMARGSTEPATVDVQRAAAKNPVPDAYLLAARQAVRLAGTEFVNFDRDYHTQQDYLLTLAPANDGSVIVRSHIVGSEEYNQEFQVSFSDTDGLATRLAELLRSRLHRVRYLWPYRITPPTILRDGPFDLRPGTKVDARMIRWLDPHRHAFTQDTRVDASVVASDADKIELGPAFASGADRDGFGFNPMSNISYRVILPRDPTQPLFFRGLTYVLVVLFTLAGILGAIDIRRHVRRRQARTVAMTSQGFRATD